MQRDERIKLPCALEEKIYPLAFRKWPILSLLKPEFIKQVRMVMVYDSGNRALVVTVDNNVYNFEYNREHLTGDTPGLCPKEIKELHGKNIKTFACNSRFILALTEDGEVYAWSFNLHGISDGDWHTLMFSNIPICLELDNEWIVDITCSEEHYLALTNDRKLYAWGKNNYGQIGNGNSSDTIDVSLPIQIEVKGQKIVQIACGSNFNIVVTDTGKLYGWGDNEKDQISNIIDKCYDNLKQKFYMYPQEMTTVSNKKINKFVKIVCGFNHTLLLTEGNIFAWGDNSYSQLGVDNELKSSSPIMVCIPELIKDIAAYANLSVAVDINETVYVWGECFGKIIDTPLPTGFSCMHDAMAHNTLRVMHKPLIVSSNVFDEVFALIQTIASNILGMSFGDPSTSDFIVQVEEQCIHVHRAILKNRCSFFKNMFHKEADKSDNYIILDKFSYITYEAFLKYLYTGTIDLSVENILELMRLADEYGETKLKKKCSEILEQAITPSNVAFFYSKAIEYNVVDIEDFCFSFAMRHIKLMILSNAYNKLDSSLKISLFERAVIENFFRA